MVVAVALSVGALLASVGLSASAARQVDADLAASTLDLLSVAVAPHASGGSSTGSCAEHTFPQDAEARVRSLEPVVGAGRRLDISALRTIDVSRRAPAAAGPESLALTVAGMTSGYLDAVGAAPTPGARWLDSDEPVVLLGPAAARALDVPVTRDPRGVSVWVDGRRHEVAGFLLEGRMDLDHVVALPYGPAAASVGTDAESLMLVRTEPGAGAAVAEIVRLALRPDDPAALQVSPVVDATALRAGVATQLGRMVGWIGALLLVLAVLLIASSAIVAVTNRTAEIGLRRALGVSRAGIAAVFLVEGGVTGLLGGLTAGALCSATVVVASALNGWTAVLQPAWVVQGPAIGAAVGLLASLYPALRAAGTEPALAVRSD